MFSKTFWVLAWICTIVGGISFFSFAMFRLSSSSSFGKECASHIYKAAATPNLAQASMRLAVAIDYIEENNLTTGTTGFAWQPSSKKMI